MLSLNHSYCRTTDPLPPELAHSAAARLDPTSSTPSPNGEPDHIAVALEWLLVRAAAQVAVPAAPLKRAA